MDFVFTILDLSRYKREFKGAYALSSKTKKQCFEAFSLDEALQVSAARTRKNRLFKPPLRPIVRVAAVKTSQGTHRLQRKLTLQSESFEKLLDLLVSMLNIIILHSFGSRLQSNGCIQIFIIYASCYYLCKLFIISNWE